jgi:hypothetical protein
LGEILIRTGLAIVFPNQVTNAVWPVPRKLRPEHFLEALAHQLPYGEESTTLPVQRYVGQLAQILRAGRNIVRFERRVTLASSGRYPGVLGCNSPRPAS